MHCIMPLTASSQYGFELNKAMHFEIVILKEVYLWWFSHINWYFDFKTKDRHGKPWRPVFAIGPFILFTIQAIEAK